MNVDRLVIGVVAVGVVVGAGAGSAWLKSSLESLHEGERLNTSLQTLRQDIENPAPEDILSLRTDGDGATLVRINATTGSTTEVGPVPGYSFTVGANAYDPGSNLFYYIAAEQGGSKFLYGINAETAEVVLQVDLPIDGSPGHFEPMG